MKRLLVTALFFAQWVMAAEPHSHTLIRSDKTQCHYYFDTSLVDTDFSIILLLHGSEMASVIPFMSIVDEPWLEKQHCVALGIEKPGITANKVNEKEYLRLNSLVQRAHDCINVLNRIRATEPQWNGKLIICGASEGATLAAYLTPFIPETKATIMFSGGCGMSLRDEILLLEKKSASSGVKGFFQKHAAYAYINYMLFLAKLFPHSSYTCIGEGNTLKYWNSIADYNPLHTLEKVSIPLYLAHGVADTNCPVESADMLAKHFKKIDKDNLYFHRYDGYDHNFNDQNGKNHWGKVADEAFAWVESILAR
jgi:dienelactone hydrolase